MKVHEYLATALAERGVDVIFGLIGDGNLFFVDDFVRQGGRYIGAVHEMNTVMMASGFATTTNRLGVATVTHGPGLTNTLSPLIEATKSGMPLLLICGDTASTDKYHPQSVDQRALVTATGAGFEQVRSSQTVGLDLASAIGRAYSERRPIVLNVPIDYMWTDVDPDDVPTEAVPVACLPEPQRTTPDPHALDIALGAILSSRRPIILAGRGAIGSRRTLIELGERLGAALATTVPAKDLFFGEPLDLGVFGTFATPVTQELILESDCVIVFGASLNPKTSDGGALLDGKMVIHCDVDGSSIGRFAKVSASVIGESGAIAREMLTLLKETDQMPAGFEKVKLCERLNEWPSYDDHSSERTIDVHVALDHFDKSLPVERSIATDAGRFTGHVMRLMHASGPTAWLNSWTGFACIGLGMGMALGGSAAHPDQLTVLVTGDGGFMLGGMNEFATASRYGLDLVCLVCNDGSYGAEHIQFVRRDLDPSLAVFRWPDLASIAESLGGIGITVRTRDDLRVADDAIRHRDRPVLIDLRLDPHFC